MKMTMNIKRRISSIGTVAVMAMSLFAGSSKSEAADYKVEVFSGFDSAVDGTPFSGLVNTYTTPWLFDAQWTPWIYPTLAPSGTIYDFNWHPSNLQSFGARLTACISVPEDETYSFWLFSDDGSTLWIDGNLVVDNSGPHGPTEVWNETFLTKGIHEVTVNFYEDFGGPSGVNLEIDNRLTPANCPSTPDGGSTIMLLGGVIGLLSAFGRRFSRAH